MRTQCPHCGKFLTGPDKWYGRVVQCPKCKGQMQVDEPEVPELTPVPRRRNPEGFPRWFWPAVVTVLILVFVSWVFKMIDVALIHGIRNP